MKIATIALLLAAGPAFGHATLQSSTPAKGTSVQSPKTIVLKFAETLNPAFSGAALTDTAGKTVPVPSAANATSITLLTFGLKPGAYTVTWHAVSPDTHRVTGKFTFKVIP